MLVPLKWLNEYIKTDLSTQELATKLTASGSSVERTYEVGQGLDDLIVGEVLAVKPHPNADRLRLATVNIGEREMEVVCGATNLAVGQHIVYAPEGARIPVDMHDEERKPFVLKKATIRGVESQGMICSVAEMGLGEDHDGILVLPAETTPGQKITEALAYPQTVLDIEVTTNRSDELSMIGIAREVSALTGKPLTIKGVTLPKHYTSHGFEPVIATEDCYRLMTQQLTVTVGPSPWWMQQYLILAGMRPVNNVVDITNFVMLEYGQPMHAYDVSKLHGDQLIVRATTKGEKLTTLDGIERELQPGMMVIADAEKVLGLAGIMGGEASKITEDTSTILLEAAAFNPIAIRKTANALALRSEASRRFERSVDREMTEMALNRAAALLVQHASGRQVGQRRNTYPQPLESKQITLTSRKLNQYLGDSIDPLEVRRILKSLGFGDTSASGKDVDWELAVRIPSWRATDIQEEVDLIEEVVRIVGYDQLPVELPGGELPNQLINKLYANTVSLKRALSQAGWMEIITLSLVGKDMVETDEALAPQIALANPLSSEWTHLRSSLIPGLITTAGRNIRHQSTMQLFELSSVYRWGEMLPEQAVGLALLSTKGATGERNLAEVKGTIAMIMARMGIDSSAISYSQESSPAAPFDSRNTLSLLIDGQGVGTVGLIKRSTREMFDLPDHTIIAEISLEGLLAKRGSARFTVLPKFQSLEEDVSVLTPESISTAEILSVIQPAGAPMLESVTLSEIYRHPSLGDKMKSSTFHLVFRAVDRTLSSQDVASARQSIFEALERKGIHIRG